MRFIWRYGFAFWGGFLAMSAHIYLLYGRANWFAPQRLSDTIGNALIFAHILAFMVLLTHDVVQQFSLFRIFIGLIGGIVLGTIAWYAHLFFYLYQTTPDILTILFGGFCLAIGFVISGLMNFVDRWRNAALAMLITAIAIYIPIYLTYQAHIADSSAQALLYFQADNPNDIFLIGLPFAITIAFFGNLPLLFSSSPHAET